VRTPWRDSSSCVVGTRPALLSGPVQLCCPDPSSFAGETHHASMWAGLVQLWFLGVVQLCRRGLSSFGCEAKHDLESRCQFADAGAGQEREVDGDGLACLAIADGAVDRVSVIERFALDVALGRDQLFAAVLDFEVDMPRPSAVWDRLDGAKSVLAVGGGQEPAEALEVAVALGAMRIL
jgi:hypothetical protein